MKRMLGAVFGCLSILHFAAGYNPSEKVSKEECVKKMDLCFIIDGSDSIAPQSFLTLKKSLADLTDKFDVGKNKTRIGMVLYSSIVAEKHLFSEDPIYIKHAARNLPHPRDGTYTNLGISSMTSMFMDYGRKKVPKVAIVITDGNSKDRALTKKTAAVAAHSGITVVAVGVGQMVDPTQLEEIASSRQLVLTINNFDELFGMLNNMMVKICPCPEPSELPLAICSKGPRAIGSVRVYECKEGYKRVGNPKITCQEDFTWTPLPNDFACIACRVDTPFVEHSTCGGVGHTIGIQREYDCKTGYRLVGNPFIQCLQNGSWSIPHFSCYDCGPTPPIKYGGCVPGDKTINAVRQFECDHGYRAVGNPEIRCMNDPNKLKPNWSKTDFACVSCTTPDVIENAECTGNYLTIDTVRKYKCKPGYREVGNPEIICMNDASYHVPYWSKTDFRCLPCSVPEYIENADCTGKNVTIGTTRNYKCKPGYRAMGKSEIKCINDLKNSRPVWTPTNFRCVSCITPDVIENAECTGTYLTIDTVRKYKCKPGYREVGNPEIICMNDASYHVPYWSKTDFRCLPCSVPDDIEYADCTGKNVTIGTTRNYKCKPGYRAMGKSEIKCINDLKNSRPVWTPTNFRCVSCITPDVIENAECTGNYLTIDTVRKYKCKPGYREVGNPEIICMNDASYHVPYWSKTDFRCLPCSVPDDIENADCTGKNVTIGTTRNYKCKPGYRAMGKSEIKCINDLKNSRPVWTPTNFRCVSCITPDVIENAECTGNYLTIDTVRKYKCKPGYREVGNPEIICMNDASYHVPYWSKTDFRCLPCSVPDDIEYADCTGKNVTIGTTRNYKCKPGYRAMGKSEIKCINDLKNSRPVWTPTNFRCVSCITPDVIENAECTGNYLTIDTVRKYKCKPGYREVGNPEIICMNDASYHVPYWSKTDFRCLPCSVPDDIENADCTGKNVTIGTTRNYKCKPGYRAMGKSEIKCINDLKNSRPVWTPTNFRCVSCITPDVIENAECTGNYLTIDTVRKYKCKPGYREVGNPEIICMNDASYHVPYWSKTDFRCLPCSVPDDIEYADCTGKNVTIGTTRNYKCKPGYRAIGNSEIKCINDLKISRPVWTPTDFHCLPCGPVPKIVHGSCGSGNDMIGSIRNLSCDAGYRAVGKPHMECIDDRNYDNPVWRHSFRCEGCGNAPYVPNAYYNTNAPDSIGNTIRYECETKYEMIGPGIVNCTEELKWVGKWFSCEAIVTTTPFPPRPHPSLCDECRYFNGVGYNSHPYDCNQYVQCAPGRVGFDPTYRRCSFGLHWDQEHFTCNYPHAVKCDTDPCLSKPDGYVFPHNDGGQCCSYWICENGAASGKCCKDGYRFVNGECRYDPTCKSKCLLEVELPEQSCQRLPNETNDNWYLQNTNHGRYENMPCAPGTMFDDAACGCIHSPYKESTVKECQPILDLPLRGDYKDRSSNKAHVEMVGKVRLSREGAHFDGNSYLMINMFSNMAFGDELAIKFRYKQNTNHPNYHQLQALATNGHCGDDPSIIMAKVPDFTLLGVKADETRTVYLPNQLYYEWTDVVYYKHKEGFDAQVCEGQLHENVYGRIKTSSCALLIGYGTQLKNFAGVISDFKVYKCRPKDLFDPILD